VVTGADEPDARADGLDDARALVAEDDRQGIGERPLDHLEVGVAEPARVDADQDVRRLERSQLDRLDHERSADVVEDRRVDSHGATPPARSAGDASRRRGAQKPVLRVPRKRILAWRSLISLCSATMAGSKSRVGRGSGSKWPYVSAPRTSVTLSCGPATCRM